jgi:hypothetical protein
MEEEVKLGSVVYCCRPIDCDERDHTALAFGWSVVSRGKESRVLVHRQSVRSRGRITVVLVRITNRSN